ncbi:MAG: AAA family ATPase [Myxococcales bacterium]|nr:AAA family ATPase [Myxococcales bacterium]
MSQAIEAQVQALVGRDGERHDARKALGTVPVLAVEGPAGIGKTALVRDLAQQLAAEDSKRVVHWVDAPETGDFRLLLYAIGRALSGPGLALRERTLADLRYWVTALVNDSDAVVIVEDLHRIRDAELDVFLRSVSSQLGRGRLLVTSRESLNLPMRTSGALPWITLAPLDGDSVYRMVQDGYRAAEIDPPSRDEVDRAGEFLEGIPDRVRTACTMSAWARLPFHEAAMQAKGGDVLDMLVIQIGADQQKAMGTLALTGYPMPEAVLKRFVDAEIDVTGYAWQLLVERRPDGLWLPYRYRQAVRHCLRVGQRLKVHDQLNDYYWDAFKDSGDVELALRSIEHALEAGRPGDAADRFERVLPTARLEGLHARVLEASRRIPERMRASRPKITGGIYFCRAFLGDKMALKRLEDALEQATSDEREGLLADLAWLHRELGDIQRSIYYRTRAVDEARKLDEQRKLLAHQMELADLHLVIRDYEMTRRILRESRELLMELEQDMPAIEGKYFLCRGMLSLIDGDLRSAEKDLGRAKLTLSEAMAFRDVGQVDRRVGRYYAALGNWEKAIESYQEAQETLRRSGDLLDAAEVELILAELHLYRGDKARATALIASANEVMREESEEYARPLEGPMKLCRSRLALFDGALVDARERLEEALRVMGETLEPDRHAELSRQLVELYSADGNFFRARDVLKRMGELEKGDAMAKGAQQERHLAEAWYALYRGEHERARTHAQQAREAAQGSHAYLRIMESLKILALAALDEHDFDRLEEVLRSLERIKVKSDRVTPLYAQLFVARREAERERWDELGPALEALKRATHEAEFETFNAWIAFLEARLADAQGRDREGSEIGAEAYEKAKAGLSLLAAEIGFFTSGVDRRRGIPGAGDHYRREARLVMAHRPDLKLLGLKVEEAVRAHRFKAGDRTKVRETALELDEASLKRAWAKAKSLHLLSRGTCTMVSATGSREVEADYRDFVPASEAELIIDAADYTTFRGREVISLDDKRLVHNLLCHLARTANNPQESSEVFTAVWAERYEGAESESRLETSMRRLRQALGGPEGSGRLLITYSSGKLGLDTNATWLLFEEPQKKRYGMPDE